MLKKHNNNAYVVDLARTLLILKSDYSFVQAGADGGSALVIEFFSPRYSHSRSEARPARIVAWALQAGANRRDDAGKGFGCQFVAMRIGERAGNERADGHVDCCRK